MTAPTAAFPDAELAVLAVLAGLGDGDVFRPVDLADRLPFWLVYRFAGADDRLTDTALIGVDTYAATRAEGLALAEQGRQRLLAAPHTVDVDGRVVVIDAVRTDQGPHEVPYGDSRTRRWVASYTAQLRRPVTPTA